MKNIKLIKRFGLFIFSLAIITSCTLTPSDPCQEIECLNDGVCINGECDCPDGFIGTNCGEIDLLAVQSLLDNGTNPKVLFDAGVSIDELYGKNYQGGILFYLDTADGTGLIGSTQDLGTLEWGCVGTSIPESNAHHIGSGGTNTAAIVDACSSSNIAAKSCSNLVESGYEDWHLPSSSELDNMFSALSQTGKVNFANSLYWSSSENGSINAYAFDFSNFNAGLVPITKDQELMVRAVRYF